MALMTVFRSPQKMRTHFRFSIFFISFSLISIAVFATALPKESLGIAPEDEKYFKSEVIKCKDGSKKFSREKLNDGFCDCPDGTDEPGTSACPEGKFYCRNVGHVPLKLFSSRVNDGICDCCDGSDEYNGKVSCPNTCWEAGKVARDKLKKKIATYQDGVTIRKREVEQAKQAIVKDEAELAELKSEEKILKELVKQLKDQKEQIERVEEQERKEKEKEEEKQREAKKTTINEDENHSTDEISHEETKVVEDERLTSQDQDTTEENIDLVGEPEDDNHAGDETSPAYEEDELLEAENNEETIVEDETGQDVGSEASPSHEEKHEKESTENTEGLSKEELGRLVASRWTGENAEQKPNEVDGGAKEEVKEHDANHEDDYEGYSSETDGNSQKYGEDEAVNSEDEYDEEDEDPLASYKPEVEDKTDFSDITTASTPSWSNKIQQAVRNILQAINLFKAPVDTSEAARVRKEYDDYSSKLSKLQSRITSLTKKLSNDYGPNKEFYSFYDHCFENKHNKYTYKVCPFKEATQGEDYSTTRLGRWDKFEDSYRSMHFLHGDKCWNGPDRSLKVKLRCGLKNELTDVDEPSRCEYVAMLSTPVVCLEERLKELQHKFDVMSTDQQQMHDEL